MRSRQRGAFAPPTHSFDRMADAPSSSNSRLGICQTCDTEPARYKCPACSFPSCSLACSTAHKQAQGCSGVAPPVWSRPLQANEMTWGSLMRDQSYIAGVNRAVEDVGRQLVADKVIPQGRGAVRSADGQDVVRLDERNDKEERLVREARRDGVDLVLLPKGMSKRVKNGTRWDPKYALLSLSEAGLPLIPLANPRHKRLEWTVEVAFQPRPSTEPSSASTPPTVITTVPQPTTSSIHAVLTSALGSRDKKGKGKALEPEEEAWVLAQKAWVETFKPSTTPVTAPAQESAPASEAADEDPVDAADEGAEPAPALPEEATGDAALPEVSEVAADPTVTSTEHPAPAEPAPAPADDAPFVLLLALYIRASPPSDNGYSNAPPSSTPARPPAREVYLVTPTASLTLRESLAGATLLETPLFEVWPRETFLRQQLLGRIKLVERPSEDEMQARLATGAREGGESGRLGTAGGGADEDEDGATGAADGEEVEVGSMAVEERDAEGTTSSGERRRTAGGASEAVQRSTAMAATRRRSGCGSTTDRLPLACLPDQRQSSVKFSSLRCKAREPASFWHCRRGRVLAADAVSPTGKRSVASSSSPSPLYPTRAAPRTSLLFSLPPTTFQQLTHDITMPGTVTSYTVEDLRFPTSLDEAGSDAMNKDGDYSAAYCTLRTDDGQVGCVSVLCKPGRGAPQRGHHVWCAGKGSRSLSSPLAATASPLPSDVATTVRGCPLL